MSAGGIVEAFDEGEDRHPGFRMRLEPTPIQQLTFQRREEALAHGVVIRTANRSHRRSNASFLAAIAKRHRRILRALVGVMDDIVWLAYLDGHVQSIQHQPCLQVCRKGPADDPAGPGIQDDGELDKAHHGWHIGDA